MAEDEGRLRDGPFAFARLKRRAEFQRAARGRRADGPAFTLQSNRRAAPDEAEGPRIGFTVTRKVGMAAARNRIRRRLKEAMRAAASDAGLEARSDHDYVLMARREALTRRFGALIEDLRRTFAIVARGGGPRAPRKPDRDRRT